MILFPDPRKTSPEGLVAVGGPMNAEALVAAYQKGIFPWPQPDLPWLWFSPQQRGVIDFADQQINRSVKRALRDWRGTEVSVNRAFTQVMEECRRQPRKGQAGTWILPEMIGAYTELFRQGKALSLEVWKGEVLVGGVYGVLSDCPRGRYFSAESMFHLETGASKYALFQLIQELKPLGLKWMDVQMVTGLVEMFGGKYISRDEFLARLGI
ncbi:MAG: leucyl/phenylalanyl-tRNA--protein transferase [Pseudobdellovibrionaceae bacterium]|jgi:leucyl/phenylalanyl-tRNA--protein transferase